MNKILGIKEDTWFKIFLTAFIIIVIYAFFWANEMDKGYRYYTNTDYEVRDQYCLVDEYLARQKKEDCNCTPQIITVEVEKIVKVPAKVIQFCSDTQIENNLTTEIYEISLED